MVLQLLCPLLWGGSWQLTDHPAGPCSSSCVAVHEDKSLGRVIYVPQTEEGCTKPLCLWCEGDSELLLKDEYHNCLTSVEGRVAGMYCEMNASTSSLFHPTGDKALIASATAFKELQKQRYNAWFSIFMCHHQLGCIYTSVFCSAIIHVHVYYIARGRGRRIDMLGREKNRDG